MTNTPDTPNTAREIAELLRLIIAAPSKFNRDERGAILSDAAWMLDLLAAELADRPVEDLSFDEAEALGLDGTLRS